jgi:hypothetical protein
MILVPNMLVNKNLICLRGFEFKVLSGHVPAFYQKEKCTDSKLHLKPACN